MQLRLNPADAGRCGNRRHQGQNREIRLPVCFVARGGRKSLSIRIRPLARSRTSTRSPVWNSAASWGIPNIQGQSGTIKGQPLQQQVDEIVKVYTEKYFPVCEKNKVRILWEPYAGGPNIGTGPVGWEALFKSF